jgi:hypothetical protein
MRLLLHQQYFLPVRLSLCHDKEDLAVGKGEVKEKRKWLQACQQR